MTGLAALGESIATREADVSDALTALVQEHARFVFKVAFAVLRNHADAEDAAQETFLRVMRHRSELASVRDVRAWLARIAWRIAVDRRRPAEVASDHSGEVLTQIASSAAGAERMAISAQMVRLAERVIAGLPEELRDVITLSTVQEMTSGEIAAVLGIPEASVRTRLFRARQLVKEKLAALLGPGTPKEK